MSHERRQSAFDGQKEPHSVSLKVLRLPRPALSYQYPLPRASTADTSEIPVEASFSYPSANKDDPFILSPLVLLPSTFGSAYVGETFSCTVCANNEVSEGVSAPVVSGVRIAAEMQTPTHTAPLELHSAAGENQPQQATLEIGSTLQSTVLFDLKEQGNHVLAVTVTYTETSMSRQLDPNKTGQASSGRVRTFRKLYQFVTQQSLAVRTKTVEVPAGIGPLNKDQQDWDSRQLRLLLEAQLENMRQDSITLETVSLSVRALLQSTSLNWDVPLPSGEETRLPMLKPREIIQVAFLVAQDEAAQDGADAMHESLAKEGRVALGQLSIEWRGAMGDRGQLSTGMLMFKRR